MGRVGSAFALCLGASLLAFTSASAQTFTTLSAFSGKNGANPENVTLIQATDGKLYGTTSYGGKLYDTGTGCPNPYGCGTVFTIAPEGNPANLYSFSPGGAAAPTVGLIQATDGNFYGTTIDGGANDCGSVYKITSAGVMTTMYSFDCDANGGSPESPLVQGLDGNLYGTTAAYGSTGFGTIFRISTSGALTTLYNFCSQPNCADGHASFGGMTVGTDGNFYGTTVAGDPSDGGTVFKITLAGAYSTLYEFCSQTNCTDGSTPYATLVQAADGNFYGTTANGGIYGNYGTVFKITPRGKLTTIYSFFGTEGSGPTAGLFLASDGNFYGTTQYGGSVSYAGTAFGITPTGVLTIIHNFCSDIGCSDGENPMGALTEDTDGTLFGTTFDGGDSNCVTSIISCGTLFKISLALPRFIEPQQHAARIGSTIVILGTNLTGATKVAFNGTPAKFTVVSGNEIKATVPSGATTGKIVITVNGRMLSSNGHFGILP